MTTPEEYERTKLRVAEMMDADFVPVHDRNNFPSPELRQAAALEYIAAQLGKIRRALELQK